MKTLFSIAVIVSTILSSCCGTTDCKNTAYFVGFELNNFDSSDFNSIVIRKFKKNSQFKIQYDSMMLSASDFNIYPYQYYDSTIKDTVKNLSTVFKPLTKPLGYMTAAYDYEIYITPINLLSKVTDIYEPQTSEKWCNIPDSRKIDSCSNPIKGYTINGKRYQAMTDYQAFNQVSIDK